MSSSDQAALGARTHAEAHLYMELRPCICGEIRFDWSMNTSDGRSCSYAGPCARCGQPREFEFVIIEPPGPDGVDGVDFGSSAPSRIIDPGEWMMVALERSKRDTRADIVFARACLEEVVKFLPAGADARVPASAFTSERGRAMHAAEQPRFSRARLLTTLHVWGTFLARYDTPAGAPVAPPREEAAEPTLHRRPVAVLIEALAHSAAHREGFEGLDIRRYSAELSAQINALISEFELKAAERRLRAADPGAVKALFEEIAKSETQVGRDMGAWLAKKPRA